MKGRSRARWLFAVVLGVVTLGLTGCFGANTPAPQTKVVSVQGSVTTPVGTAAQSVRLTSQATVSGGAVAGAKVVAYSFATGKPLPSAQHPATATTDADGHYTLSGIPDDAGMIYVVVTKSTSAGELRMAAMVEVTANAPSKHVTADVTVTSTLTAAAWTPQLGTGVKLKTADIAATFDAAVDYVADHVSAANPIDLIVGEGVIQDDGSLAPGSAPEAALKQTLPDALDPNLATLQATAAVFRTLIGAIDGQENPTATLGPVPGGAAAMMQEVDRILRRLEVADNLRQAVQDEVIDRDSQVVYACSGKFYVASYTPTVAATDAGFGVQPCADAILPDQLDADVEVDGDVTSFTFSSPDDPGLNWVVAWTGSAGPSSVDASFTDSALVYPVSVNGVVERDADGDLSVADASVDGHWYQIQDAQLATDDASYFETYGYYGRPKIELGTGTATLQDVGGTTVTLQKGSVSDYVQRLRQDGKDAIGTQSLALAGTDAAATIAGATTGFTAKNVTVVNASHPEGADDFATGPPGWFLFLFAPAEVAFPSPVTGKTLATNELTVDASVAGELTIKGAGPGSADLIVSDGQGDAVMTIDGGLDSSGDTDSGDIDFADKSKYEVVDGGLGFDVWRLPDGSEITVSSYLEGFNWPPPQ